MYEKTTLPNGLRVITHRMPATYSITATAIVGAGSRYEPADHAGVSHFVEHMLFKGTRRRPTAKEVAEAIEGIGGILNAATEKETTTYFAKVPMGHRALALDLLADMLRHSRFLRAEVEKERRVIAEEIRMGEDMPQDLVNTLIDELTWPDHPLGREIAGTEQSVAAMARPALLAYVAERYVPDNVVLSIAGNVEHAWAVEQVERLLGDWRPRPVVSFEPAPRQPGPVRHAVRHKDTEQVHICLSAGGLPRQHLDRRALDLLDLILGGGMSSRLFLEIRERRALAYDVAASLDYYQDTGATVIYAGTEPEQTAACVEAMIEEMRRLRRELVPVDELRRAKEYFKGRMLLGLEDSGGMSHWLGAQELLTGRILAVDDIVAEVDAVTAEDVLRVATAAYSPDQLRLALVGPVEDSPRLGELLDAA